MTITFVANAVAFSFLTAASIIVIEDKDHMYKELKCLFRVEHSNTQVHFDSALAQRILEAFPDVTIVCVAPELRDIIVDGGLNRTQGQGK